MKRVWGRNEIVMWITVSVAYPRRSRAGVAEARP